MHVWERDMRVNSEVTKGARNTDTEGTVCWNISPSAPTMHTTWRQRRETAAVKLIGADGIWRMRQIPFQIRKWNAFCGIHISSRYFTLHFSVGHHHHKPTKSNLNNMYRCRTLWSISSILKMLFRENHYTSEKTCFSARKSCSSDRDLRPSCSFTTFAFVSAVCDASLKGKDV